MSQKEAEALMHRWMATLGLFDWDIRLKWRVRSEDMPGEDALGYTNFNIVSKQAIVYMLDPVDFRNDFFTYDYEEVLIHELLHIKFANLHNSDSQLMDLLLHQHIQDLAKSFRLVSRLAYKTTNPAPAEEAREPIK